MTRTFGLQVVRISHINSRSFRCAPLLGMGVGHESGGGVKGARVYSHFLRDCHGVDCPSLFFVYSCNIPVLP